MSRMTDATTPTGRVRLHVGLLGPVTATREDLVPLSLAPLERALLACLAVSAGRARTIDDIVDGLWGEDGAPNSAIKLVQVLVSRVRRAAGSAGRAIETVPAGYRLAPDAAAVDAWQFEGSLVGVRDAVRGGRWADALGRIDPALALWRGPALMDVRARPFAVHEASRLDELRVAMLTDRAACWLATGRIEQSVEALTALRRDQPLDERVAGLLMRSLYAAGRQADALAVYHDVRTALDEELGVEPGSELEETQRLVLSQDPGLLAAVGSRRSAPGGTAPTDGRRMPRTSLPASLTRLIGRVEELAAVEASLKAHRLVTITGPGGVGKTRLALEAAAAARDRFPDGVHFVDVASVRDATLLPSALAESLELELGPGYSPERVVTEAATGRRLLLVLDNLEQIPDGAPFIARLLAAATELHVLATSRIPLWIRGEMEVTLDPLPLPDASATDIADLRANPAVELFLDHAAHHGSAALTEANRAVVIDICRRLDGLPLAIELVAARVRSLPLDAVRAQLARRLDVRGVQVDLPNRQRTLRDTVGWSVELLSPVAASLFRRMSVFVGGCTLGAAEAVSADDGGGAGDALEELARHSLVVHGERFAMLETIREFAADALEASGEGDEARAQALAWVTSVVTEAEARFARAEDQRAAIASADAERANVRTLLEWAAGSGREDAALRLAANRHFWAMHGSVGEGRAWIEELLGRAVDYPPDAVAQARTVLASMLLRVGDLAGAQVAWEAASRLWDTLGETRKVAAVQNNLGIVAERQDDLDRSRAHGVRALELMRTLGDEAGVVATIGNLGVLALRQGDLEAASRYNEEALALGRQSGNIAFASIALANLAGIAIKLGDGDLARSRLLESLSLARQLDDVEGLIVAFECFGELAAAEGDAVRAVRLHGGVDRLREEADAARSGWEREQVEELLGRCRDAIGQEAFDRQWQAGRGFDRAALVREAEALATTPPPSRDA